MQKKTVTFCIKEFDKLSLIELYDLLALRTEVFVVEQECFYQEVDGKDKNAQHILGKKEGKLVAYARLLKKGASYKNHTSLGRLVVKKKERGRSLGHELLSFCLDYIKDNQTENKIKISAQSHLESFYNQHGFVKYGEQYLEDGIPHILMIKEQT